MVGDCVCRRTQLINGVEELQIEAHSSDTLSHRHVDMSEVMSCKPVFDGGVPTRMDPLSRGTPQEELSDTVAMLGV